MSKQTFSLQSHALPTELTMVHVIRRVYKVFFLKFVLSEKTFQKSPFAIYDILH